MTAMTKYAKSIDHVERPVVYSLSLAYVSDDFSMASPCACMVQDFAASQSRAACVVYLDISAVNDAHTL